MEHNSGYMSTCSRCGGVIFRGQIDTGYGGQTCLCSVKNPIQSATSGPSIFSVDMVDNTINRQIAETLLRIEKLLEELIKGLK